MVKKILSITLAMLMLTSMFAVNTLAVSTTSETAVFTQDFETAATYGSAGYKNNEYADGGRFYVGGTGGLTFETENDNKYAKFTAGTSDGRLKVFVDQTVYENGATYKFTAKVKFVSEAATKAESIKVSFGTLQGVSSTTVVNKKDITLTEGVETTIEGNVFTYDSSATSTTNVFLVYNSANNVTSKVDYLCVDDVKVVKVTTSSFNVFEGGDVDFDDLSTSDTLELNVDYTRNGSNTGVISNEQAYSEPNSLKVKIAGATHNWRMLNVIPSSLVGKQIEIKMMIYPTAVDAGGYQIQVDNGSGTVQKEAVYTFAQTADAANNALAINQWNEVSVITTANATYPHVRFRGNSGSSTATFYVDDITVAEYVPESVFKGDHDIDFENITSLTRDVDWTRNGSNTVEISTDVANSGAKSAKASIASGTHRVTLVDAIDTALAGQTMEVSMYVYPTLTDTVGFNVRTSSSDHTKTDINRTYTVADEADLANNVLKVNAWNKISFLTKISETFNCITFRGNDGSSVAQVLYVDDIKVAQPTEYFDVDADAGYYAETADAAEKDGVIAVNASARYSINSITEYGIWVYRADDNSIEATLTGSAEDLQESDGKFHAFVTNIPEAHFGTGVVFKPYVILNGEYVFNSAFTFRVNDALKWLGAAAEVIE